MKIYRYSSAGFPKVNWNTVVSKRSKVSGLSSPLVEQHFKEFKRCKSYSLIHFFKAIWKTLRMGCWWILWCPRLHGSACHCTCTLALLSPREQTHQKYDPSLTKFHTARKLKLDTECKQIYLPFPRPFLLSLRMLRYPIISEPALLVKHLTSLGVKTFGSLTGYSLISAKLVKT